MTTMTHTEQLQHIVQAAGLAPSVHNTQPWRFVEGDGSLELYADTSRQLPVLDPTGRQLHLSCGAALYQARVTARALGLDAAVELLPDSQQSTLLARLLLSQGAPPTVAEVATATAILHRHTFRGTFGAIAVPAELVAALRASAEAEGAVLDEVDRREDLLELAVLLSHADASEEQDDAYRQELQTWLRAGPDAVDGLPHGATAQSAPGSTLRQRDFLLDHPTETNGSAPTADRPVVLVLTTEGDDALAWLRDGQALAAVLLAAADADVQAQPLGQLTDSPAYRSQLRALLNLVGIPQLVLRMGSSTTAHALTPRRDVTDVLVPLPH